MSALKGRIPRGPFDHRTREGLVYTGHVRALLERLGPLPDSASPTLKQAGILAVELDRESAALQRSLKRRRVREANRTRRRMTIARTQLMHLERRLEELAASHAPDFAHALGKVVNLG